MSDENNESKIENSVLKDRSLEDDALKERMAIAEIIKKENDEVKVEIKEAVIKEDPVSKSQKIRKEIISWAITIFGAVAVALLINNFIIVNAFVPSGSMLETIQPKTRIVAFRLSYVFNEPKRFDIVVFKYPDDPSDKTYYVKRIIGLPGETLEIKEGKVYINGSTEPLDDHFVTHPMYDNFVLDEPIPEGCYFMLGDNRSDSQDSRKWRNKFLHKDKIMGRVLFSYFPKIKTIK